MTTPIEANARKLIGVLARHPTGATSEELRREFEQDSSLNRQSFYNTLRFAKAQNWLIGGGGWGQLYQLNPDRCWQESSTGEIPLEKEPELPTEVECLRDWSAGSDANGAGVAVAALARIVADARATARQRIRAASTILSYKTQDDAVVGFAKKYLQSACTDVGVATDYRIEASEALRRSEDPKLVPVTERPPARVDVDPEKPIPLRELVALRREKYRIACEAAEAAEREQQLASLKPGPNANGGGDDSGA